MPQQTKSIWLLWLLLRQVLLLPLSKRCLHRHSLRPYSNTSTKRHHMWKMQFPSITRPSSRPHSPLRILKCHNLTTITTPKQTTSSSLRKIKGWHPNSRHKQRPCLILRERPQQMWLQLLQLGFHVINSHYNSHLYLRLRGLARVTIRALQARITTSLTPL